MPKLSIDEYLDTYGVKYFFVDTGMISLLHHADDADMLLPEGTRYWCELSWNTENEYDFAFNDFGKTLEEAIGHCINSFMTSRLPQVMKCRASLNL